MLDQGNNFYLISLNILISCLLSNVRILLGEVSCWSLLGVKGLNKFSLSAPNVEERVWRMRILMSGEWYLLKMMINDADDCKLYDNWQTAGSLSLGVLLVITGLRQTDAIYSIPMTVTTYTSYRPNISLVHVWESIKKQFSFAKKKIHFYWSTHA